MTNGARIAVFAALGAAAFLVFPRSALGASSDSESGGDMSSYDSQLQSVARKYGISDWLILKAIMGNESSYGRNPAVLHGIENPGDADGSKSSDGKSWGLFQFTLPTANWLRPGTTVADLNNPDVSIELAGKYVSWLLNRYGSDLKSAVEAYNEGPGNVDNGIPDDDYWNKFQQHYSELQNQG